MKKSKTLLITIPLMAILLAFFIYQYGYLRIQAETASIKEEQAIKTKTLERYITLISEKPDLEKRLASLKEARKADDSKLIEGQTPPLAAAQLQEIVKSIVTDRGGTKSSERVGKSEDLGKFKVISVSVDTIMPDIRAVSDIIYSIETKTPYLIIKEINLRQRERNHREIIVFMNVSALIAGK